MLITHFVSIPYLAHIHALTLFYITNMLRGSAAYIYCHVTHDIYIYIYNTLLFILIFISGHVGY